MWSNSSCLISLALGASDSHSWPDSRAAVKAAEEGANTAGERWGGIAACDSYAGLRQLDEGHDALMHN